MMATAIAGLSQSPKVLPAKLLYDERGSQLFEAICDLPEYYPTRTEIGILQRHAEQIATLIGSNAQLIEFGSGWSIKTRILLEAIDQLASYVPIDISCEPLLESARKLRAAYPHLQVHPLCVDYEQDFSLPDNEQSRLRRVAFFPGSTIGNFPQPEARAFLNRIADLVGPDGALLIGVDLQKDLDILLPAYNDAQGITAEFNLNLLHRLNREAGANFEVEQFEHWAIWNEAFGRIEMRLISQKEQNVQIGNATFNFQPGESICTEYSYKYTLEGFAQLAERFRVEEVWTDARSLFSVQYLTQID
ncbi:L-histidine N(alpha)-methyltransferase [Romeria aff. gracilis LEGE 07310]|uniref:L-histidine N(Alpha)-methyltransferase n=1 Tax=Vasconcelosia minhoensis LEGE 07310 TaxID=915328 RepID=A0A8J7AGV2_9CYAN|nr:L-histidine N(alpha)-methyltransferase [Romeria aff. gracilis LEGE 07310]